MKKGKKNLKERYAKVKKGSSGLWYIKDSTDLEEMGILSFKSKKGDNFLAFLPQRDPAEDYFNEIFVHYDVGASGQAFLCPKRMYEEDCPVCMYADTLKRAGEPKDIYRTFLPTTRFLFFIVDVTNSSETKKGIQIYDAPRTIMTGIIGQSELPRSSEVLDISDPLDGFNLVFRRTGMTQNNTKYEGFQREDRRKAIPQEFYDEVPSFDEVLVAPDIEAMEKALNVAPDDDEEYEAPRKVSKRKDRDEEEEKPKRVSKARKVSEPDDEEEEEKSRSRSRAVKEEDDEEEEKPRSRVSRSRKEEDDEEIDGEEEEKPRSSSRKSSSVRKKKDDGEIPFEEDDEEEIQKVRDRVRSSIRSRR